LHESNILLRKIKDEIGSMDSRGLESTQNLTKLLDEGHHLKASRTFPTQSMGCGPIGLQRPLRPSSKLTGTMTVADNTKISACVIFCTQIHPSRKLTATVADLYA